jgi:hypothetical protein
MAYEGYVDQFLGSNDLKDIFDERIERNVWAQQMRAIPRAGVTGSEHAMTQRAQPIGDPSPAPTAVPRAMRKNEGSVSVGTKGEVHIEAPILRANGSKTASLL